MQGFDDPETFPPDDYGQFFDEEEKAELEAENERHKRGRETDLFLSNLAASLERNRRRP